MEDVSPSHHDSGDGIDDAADLEYLDIMAHVRKLSVRTNSDQDYYFGPSSTLYFMRKVLQMRGLTSQRQGDEEDDWEFRPVIDSSSSDRSPLLMVYHKWEIATIQQHHPFTFPDPRLLSELIDLYFSSMHRQLPVLHEPTFRRDIASGFHLCDRRFASITLLVCALGSRVSDDPRVFIPGEPKHSAGWPWFAQVLGARNSPYEQTTLHDVQCSCVGLMYCLLLLSVSYAISAYDAVFLVYVWNHGSLARSQCWFAVLRYIGLSSLSPWPSDSGTRAKEKGFLVYLAQCDVLCVLICSNRCTYVLDRHVSFYAGKPSSYRDEEYSRSVLYDELGD